MKEVWFFFFFGCSFFITLALSSCSNQGWYINKDNGYVATPISKCEWTGYDDYDGEMFWCDGSSLMRTYWENTQCLGDVSMGPIGMGNGNNCGESNVTLSGCVMSFVQNLYYDNKCRHVDINYIIYAIPNACFDNSIKTTFSCDKNSITEIRYSEGGCKNVSSKSIYEVGVCQQYQNGPLYIKPTSLVCP